MELHGSCQKCQAPVFLNKTTDLHGNSVLTLNCWNGHYKWIHIEDIEEIEAIQAKTPPKENPVTYIGFFDLS
jgi:hypothetical protein